MTKRISELPAAVAIADTDEVELNQSGVSRKATKGQMVAGLASATHQHGLADVTDSGALAALDAVGTAEFEASAYASAAEAVAGTENSKVMTALRTAEAIAAQPPGTHQHVLGDVTDAGALASLDRVGTGQIETAAYASQSEAIAGSENSKIMTALRTAEAIVALLLQHQHVLADVTDAGPLAYLDLVGAGEIAPNAVTSGKILASAVTEAKLANLAVSNAETGDRSRDLRQDRIGGGDGSQGGGRRDHRAPSSPTARWARASFSQAFRSTCRTPCSIRPSSGTMPRPAPAPSSAGAPSRWTSRAATCSRSP